MIEKVKGIIAASGNSTCQGKHSVFNALKRLWRWYHTSVNKTYYAALYWALEILMVKIRELFQIMEHCQQRHKAGWVLTDWGDLPFVLMVTAVMVANISS